MVLAYEHFQTDWADQTTLHPLGLAMLLACGAALLLVRRKYATWPLIFLACFVSQAQRVVVGGLDFDFLRIMTLFGTVRVITRNEHAKLRWNRLDSVVVCWALAVALFPVLREGPSVIVNRLGGLYDVLGMYFLFRCLIRDHEDLLSMTRGLALASLPVAVFFLVEWSTARNIFATFGGIPAVTMIRDGQLRCQGAFSHPILAGCFWAAAMPLMAGLWWQRRRLLAVVSCAAALFIVSACASSTPVLAVLAGVIGVAAYSIRGQMRWVRWGIVCTLFALHMVMKQPVWHLIARTSSLGGSSWHRFALVDGVITHFDEWWLMGSSVGTEHWGHFTFDVTNYYIVQAIQGGVVLLGLFLLLIAVGFGAIGRKVRQLRDYPSERFTIWLLGVSLFVHAVNHFGVSYFGQIWLGWYAVLGAIGSLTGTASVPRVQSNAVADALFSAAPGYSQQRVVVLASDSRNIR